jgi:hypothetical protein
MTEVGQAAAWLVFFGLVLLARVLVTRPARRILGPWVRRVGDWAADHLNPPEDIDPEDEELAIIRRRQRLFDHLDRVRRILATDMAMSATRQVGNRLAYAWLQEELERTPEPFLVTAPSRSVSLVSRDPRRGSTVEILEIGWRH